MELLLEALMDLGWKPNLPRYMQFHIHLIHVSMLLHGLYHGALLCSHSFDLKSEAQSTSSSWPRAIQDSVRNGRSLSVRDTQERSCKAVLCGSTAARGTQAVLCLYIAVRYLLVHKRSLSQLISLSLSLSLSHSLPAPQALLPTCTAGRPRCNSDWSQIVLLLINIWAFGRIKHCNHQLHSHFELEDVTTCCLEFARLFHNRDL